jgi:uncharacterized protein (TIGR03083 family)
MQLSPRYGAEPVIVLDGPPGDIVGPCIRQRLRLATAAAAFTDEQLAHASRCEDWSIRDVIAHLDSTNVFYFFSIEAGLRREPTQVLATFDPATTPADIVATAEGVSPRDVLARFTASNAALADLLRSLDDEDWSALAEAPPGHVSISATTHHALWDSWVHERDILVPSGIAPAEEADEISACLRYVAALGPALALNHGTTNRGTLAVDVIEPDVSFVVEIDRRVAVYSGKAAADLQLTGSAVEVLEALSLRRPLDQPIPAASSWMLGGLAEAFHGGLA